MSYHFTKIVDYTFDETIEKVTEELKKDGFGILTEIDVQATFKKKLDIDFRKYRILGACNPNFAHKAINAEPMIGTMLPCNVLVQETEDGKVQISGVDPVASMAAIENATLGEVATTVQGLMKAVIERV
jgi:uncharacterized protein (DUF302 family)